MTSSVEDSRAQTTNRLGRLAAMAPMALLLLVTIVLRFTSGSSMQLWIDEVSTAMIVSQPTLSGFIREVTYDVNAPLYYLLADLWARLSGNSDQALRLLPFIFGAAAPFIVLFPKRLIDRSTRLAWCVLLACWVPGIWFSQTARWYTLTYCLAVANAVAYLTLLRSPTKGRAWAWTSLSSLLILSHYYGAVLVAVQGIAYLAIHRGRAVRSWPAALAFVPPLAFIVFQSGRLLALANPQTTWLSLLHATDIFWISGFVLGDALMVFPILLWAVAAVVYRHRSRGEARGAKPEASDYLWVVAACSLVAAAISVGVGFIRPAFIDRYVMSFVPGCLLGLVLFSNRFARSWRLATPILLAIFIAFAAHWAVAPYEKKERYYLESAVRFLMSARPTHLVFLWDNLMRPEKSTLVGLGGFLFARAGAPVTVDPVVVPFGDDPNPVLLTHAKPGSVILWIYDFGVRGTNAIRFRPKISKIDPRWFCRNFGSRHFEIYACGFKPPDPGLT